MGKHGIIRLEPGNIEGNRGRPLKGLILGETVCGPTKWGGHDGNYCCLSKAVELLLGL